MARPASGRSSRTLVLVLLLALLGALLAWQQGWLAPAPPPPVAAPKPPTPPPFQSAWSTEQEWLVDRITRDIREMAALAAGKPLPPADAPAVEPDAVRFEEHLFSPRGYEAVAREALGDAPPAAPDPKADAEAARLLSSLLDPQPPVLIAADAALSSRLTAAPAAPGLHEQAALLLAAFALTDCGKTQTDPRLALARATAHLALAGALRGAAEPGPAGRFAEASLVSVLGRERDALARLDALAAAPASPAATAWIRALRLRSTGDYRIARDAKRLSLLETLEQFRALVQSHNDQAALDWLEQREPAPLPDWGRIALDSYSPSVETSNRFAQAGLFMGLAQAADVLKHHGRTPADEAGFLDAIEERPGSTVRREPQGEPRIEVLGFGLWADRLQRSLVSDLMYVISHYYMVGQPGARKAFAEQARSRYGRLALYPLVLRDGAEDAESYRTAMAAARELALRSPERLTGGSWLFLLRKEDYAPVPRDLPDPNQWFRPALPQGTLLEVEWRISLLNELKSLTPTATASLRELAPQNVTLAIHAASVLPGDQRTTPYIAAVYGPLADFHVGIMANIAQAAWYDPPEFRKRKGALCELDAEQCFVLGHRLAELGFPDEAAVAYQKGFDGARDRVKAANESQWLVDYYFDHGRLKQAEAVAREAADVYSAPGLYVMARLMERMGRLPEAEDYYRRMLDRYDQAAELAGFYYRQVHVAKKPAFEEKLRTTLALALPPGLEPFDRAALPPRPVDGVVIKKENDNTKRYDIHWGNVIVALDGYRVRSTEAFGVVRALSQSPRMKLVIWRGRSYDDVEVELWDRRFRVDIETLAKTQ